MTTKPTVPAPSFLPPKVKIHPVQAYINAIRSGIARDDPFGQALIRLSYRRHKVTANGLLRRVAAVQDAVVALGGANTEGRIWASQAMRWKRDGKAVEQKFAKYEVDARCMATMNELVSFVSGLPGDLVPPIPPTSPFSGLFGRPSALPQPPPIPSPSNPFNAPPNGPRPLTPPQPPPRPGLFGSSGKPAFAPDPLPHFVALAFDALVVPPDPPHPFESLQKLAERISQAADESPFAAVEPESEPALPTELPALYERYHAGEDDDARGTILKQIGLINDPRTLDHFYSVFKGTDTEPKLLNIFAFMGNDIGVSGLLSLLPIASDRRADWLSGLDNILEDARQRDLRLSEVSKSMVWQVAMAETAPNVSFCQAAFELLAELGTPEAASLLWERASSAERDDLRAITYILLRLDPGDRLIDLLTLYANIIETPHTPFTPRADPMKIGIPFDKLAGALRHSKPRIAHAALTLIGRLVDPRVTPILITQLTRKQPEMREMALRHLKRLKATAAGDTVAKLMARDKDLRMLAAETLCEWEDPRCVPILIEAAKTDESADVEKLIKRIGHLKHPAFDAWLIDGLEDIKPDELSEREDAIIAAIQALVEVQSDNLNLLFNKLLGASPANIRIALARNLPKLQTDWARKMQRTLLFDKVATVSYAAAVNCRDGELARELIALRDETRRLLGVRVLWNIKDAEAIYEVLLTEKTGAVRDLCIVALGFLHHEPALPTLKKLIETEDRFDLWSQNGAILAYRSMAKMGAFVEKKDAVG